MNQQPERTRGQEIYDSKVEEIEEKYTEFGDLLDNMEREDPKSFEKATGMKSIDNQDDDEQDPQQDHGQVNILQPRQEGKEDDELGHGELSDDNDELGEYIYRRQQQQLVAGEEDPGVLGDDEHEDDSVGEYDAGVLGEDENEDDSVGEYDAGVLGDDENEEDDDENNTDISEEEEEDQQSVSTAHDTHQINSSDEDSPVLLDSSESTEDEPLRKGAFVWVRVGCSWHQAQIIAVGGYSCFVKWSNGTKDFVNYNDVRPDTAGKGQRRKPMPWNENTRV